MAGDELHWGDEIHWPTSISKAIGDGTETRSSESGPRS